MSEQIFNVQPAQLLAIIGEQYIELRMLREVVVALRSENEKLKGTANGNESASPVQP